MFSSKHGGVFTLNMVGTYITVLAEHEPLRGYLSALASGLNLRDEVVDRFWFLKKHLEIHRHFITDHVSNNPDNMSVMVQQLVDALRSSVQVLVPANSTIDLFQTVRVLFLRATIIAYFGYDRSLKNSK